MQDEAWIRKKIEEVFFPYAGAEVERARRDGIRFVHYTDAEAAISILQRRQIWLRNALLMNDFSEMEHGRRCLTAALNDLAGSGSAFRSVLNSIAPNLDQRLVEQFAKFGYDIHGETYLLAVSEHAGGEEDRFGRLSMWRAYGGRTPIALVFNAKGFLSESNPFEAFATPVAYEDESSFKRHFGAVAQRMRENVDFLRSIGPDDLVEYLLTVFRFAVMATKHPGFREEREWRVIHSPTISASTRLEQEIRCVGGVPQKLFKLPLRDFPDEGFVGASIPELIDRIIIGPTPHPWPIAASLTALLEEAGVANPDRRISISEVPLRT